MTPDPAAVRAALAEIDDMRKRYQTGKMPLFEMLKLRGSSRISDFTESAARAWLAENEPRCSTCKKHPAEELHTCPYRVDIDNDPDFQCDCCEDCENECAMDI